MIRRSVAAQLGQQQMLWRPEPLCVGVFLVCGMKQPVAVFMVDLLDFVKEMAEPTVGGHDRTQKWTRVAV